MPPTNNIGYLIQHLAFTLTRQSDQVLQERLGIGYSQFKILMALRWKGNVQQKQIAERLGQTEASISRQIKLLHDMGLLSSRKSPQNRREHLTILTPKGERIIDEALRALNNYHAPVFGGLSEKQTVVMMKSLTLMHQETCNGDRPAACHHIYNYN